MKFSSSQFVLVCLVQCRGAVPLLAAPALLKFKLFWRRRLRTLQQIKQIENLFHLIFNYYNFPHPGSTNIPDGNTFKVMKTQKGCFKFNSRPILHCLSISRWSRNWRAASAPQRCFFLSECSRASNIWSRLPVQTLILG